MLPSPVEYLPFWQLEHSDAADDAENLFGPQGTQDWDEFAPAVPEKVPLRQDMHVFSRVAPWDVEYFPA